YLATIIGLPIIYSLDQKLSILSGFTDTWWQTIIYPLPMILVTCRTIYINLKRRVTAMTRKL
ncbi:hypothetical protein CUM52_05880, partial [Enterococcus faecalis]